MSSQRRDFLYLLGLACSGGMILKSDALAAQRSANSFYEVPAFGNVHLLHFTDCHAQLLPGYFNEPSVNLGFGNQFGTPPHLVAEKLLKHYGFKSGSKEAYAFSSLDFKTAAKHYGKVGGFAHLATLVKRLKSTRPSALLLDGGDTWQGSATALWSNAQDMIDASLLLGVDVMTAHWEMTLGAKRLSEVVDNDFKNKVSFVAQNISTRDFGDPVFEPYTLKYMNGVLVGIIGQAFPYTPIAHPSRLVPDWTFGIQEERLQKIIREIRSKGASVVVLLSHNGMDVDLKLASRVSGLDAILGGHTHDGVPKPIKVSNPEGVTLVTNAGSNGKFLGVLDFKVQSGRVQDFQYKLLPIFAELIAPDPSMVELIAKHRAPYQSKLTEPLAQTDELLYRRGNFNGTFDQLIVNGLLKIKDAEIAFSPGFRWGTTLLPNQLITYEDLMAQTAISYPATTLNELSGSAIKNILEDVADNLFNPDPYYQQGGDMVRVGGLQYSIDPNQSMGHRISHLTLKGRSLDPDKLYRVAGWASVSDESSAHSGEPIWDLMSQYLRDLKVVEPMKINTPFIKGVQNNPGFSNQS